MRAPVLLMIVLTLAIAGCSTVATRPRTAAAKGGVLYHRVERGETLSLIAERYTGNGGNWRQLILPPGRTDANRLRVGDKVGVPLKLSRACGTACGDEGLRVRPRSPRRVQTVRASPRPTRQRVLAAASPNGPDLQPPPALATPEASLNSQQTLALRERRERQMLSEELLLPMVTAPSAESPAAEALQ